MSAATSTTTTSTSQVPKTYPKTSISSAHMKAAKQAVAPAPAKEPQPGVGIVGTALKTPSWTSIVEAYHKDGGGDREMLLALLHAKAKEDERLAALDILRSEQLRAYSAHLALYHPLAYHQPSHAIPPTTTTSASPASSSSSGAHPAATAAALAAYASSYYGALTQHPHHTPSHYYPSPAPSTSAHASAPTQPRRCASARGKNDEASPKTAHSSTTADRTSRSPSLTRSSTSRQSSVDLEAVKTPSEENALAIIRDAFTSPRTNDFSLPAAAVASTSNDDSAAMSVASSLVAAAAAAQQTAGKAHKRKRPIGGIREEEEEEEEDTDDQARDHRRFVRRTTPPGAINSRRVVHTQAPRSLKHILNDDLLRPLGNTRVATSDVRSRSLSGEE